ncbi:FlgD-like protein [Pedobacter psychrotolerans]|nr:lamin tail domain-containing protein [Pedobacter psychrotolerans]TCO28711.1 FlgD-like protein [Pedobacter psychrotolerans]
MKKILLISLLLLCKIAFSQVTESFSDGDFSQDPTWKGNVNDFQVNAQKQLQSKGQRLSSQTIALSTTNRLSLNASWEFLVQLNFNPTSTNFVRIYLIADKEDLKGSLNGYYVQVGETGATDGFHLYRQSGTSTSRIITGPQKKRSKAGNVYAKVKVTRDASGKWELFTDIAGGNNFNMEGSVTDATFRASVFAGIFCKYSTASRCNQYFFDDFIIKDLIPDTTPPILKSISVINSKTLEVTFSEPLDSNTAISTANYVLSNSYGNPYKVTSTTQKNVYRLTFLKEFESGLYNLNLNNIRDIKGNVIAANSSMEFTYIKTYAIKYGDIVINEIFANPGGSATLLQKEYVEIWNTTNEYILTQGWKYADQTSTFTFPVDTIKPNQYIILTAKADEALFKPYGKTIGLATWPSLNNDKDILTLSDNSGKIIDKVAYSDMWYKDEVKRRGGFSLELIDPKNICTGIQNWIGSSDVSGGTPGKQNAAYKNQLSAEVLKLINAIIIDSVTVQVEFSKVVDSLSAVDVSNYSINNGSGNPKSITIHPDYTTVTLHFLTNLFRGVENRLTITNVTDCAGKVISAAANTANLFMAKKIERNDILVSEVLFNPKPGGVDFVEVFNHTNQPLDLKDLQIANVDSNGVISNVKSVSNKNVLINPNTYWVLSTNMANVKLNYFVQNPDNFVQLGSIPAYNNDKGSVILLSNHLIIDRLDYDAKTHHPLIQNNDGVSLERVSFDVATNEPGNFKSAAATVGFATPTYKNSQELGGDENYVRLLSKIFSPDGDSFEDLVTLEYQVSSNASLATVNIYTDKGRLVKKLLKNQTIGTNGILTWDGLNDNGQKAAIGIYIMLFDVFDLKGNTKRYKNTCVLAGKLN